ncbi:isochorismatase family protein [Rhodobium gokarnense]|uniref:Nicotinamidase-related amidase n=1 Tax=Rhodobium gokarnense TaxID=364296 RepID=A0ABT3H9K1_9HYPH|nr:isochorismatase family protein [Rhodobium gokarnense]MCW2307070.1 nicotinamidase-related amidase [Rhodobium gokarnense]
MAPKTLLEMAGVAAAPSRLSESVLIIIDAQEEYRSGLLPLEGVAPAVAAIARLLARARAAGVPVHHVAHAGQPGGAFDRSGPGGAIMAEVAPRDGEPVHEKPLPNSFQDTDLADSLAAGGCRNLIITGFMNHMCVDATTRAAVDRGFRVTIPAEATATRDLPGPAGEGVVPAATLKAASLAGLADRFATVVGSVDDIPD